MAFWRSVTAANVLFLIVLTLTSHSCQTGSKQTASAPSNSPATNVVAEFFSHADRQYETTGQKAEIIRALRDMSNKSAQELRSQRYADYQGVKDAWSLTDLIERYFVPSQPVPDWTESSFYRDVSKPEAQDAIRRQLADIEKESPAH
jgi:hypothetical protein